MKAKSSKGVAAAEDFFESRGWKAFAFQRQTWEAMLSDEEGIVNAPTGSGKTYSAFLGAVARVIEEAGTGGAKSGQGLKIMWITPLRALANDIALAMKQATDAMGLDWRVETRVGDTSAATRRLQKKQLPEVLVTTPESLHVLMAKSGYTETLSTLQTLVCDEWHELMGSKRGVMIELAVSHLRVICPGLQMWGISATIGNMEEAMDVLLGTSSARKRQIIKADIEKVLKVITVYPDEVDRYPWAGHIGVRMVGKVLPIIHANKSTLVFTNTRAQAEIWYQALLNEDPDLAGVMAIHHGSLDAELRVWVEHAISDGRLKAVVCTSSLDLGVDFRPVEAVVQIGSPKSVARFAQRAGRSGHQPGKPSIIHIVPTNAMELIEAAALRDALDEKLFESKAPLILQYDVLCQYLVTLAVSDGFTPSQAFDEVKKTVAFQLMTEEEFGWVLDFLVEGGQSLGAYAEFLKVVVDAKGVYRVTDRTIALRHRMSIGTIIGESSLFVQFLRGARLGVIEEMFVSRMKEGDTFWFSGRKLEFIQIKDMTVLVRATTKKATAVATWMGGRMQMSGSLAAKMREEVGLAAKHDYRKPELEALMPLLETQRQRSIIPAENEILIEKYQADDGYHLAMFPFEGRLANEGLAALMALRMSRIKDITVSFSMDDYGFELLCDQPMPIEEALAQDLFTTHRLHSDLLEGANVSEMARRQFRDIARIAGLVFQGYPNKMLKARHLQANSQLFFDVFREYEPDNLLFKQAYDQVLRLQLDETRLYTALTRLTASKVQLVTLSKPSPFGFGLMIDHLREKLTTEKLTDRVKRLQLMAA